MNAHVNGSFTSLQAADGKDRELREILNGHYVYCAEDEVAMYREKIEEKKRKAGL